MKVLLCTREDYLRNFEGDSKQVIKTYEYLKKIGAEVIINRGEISDFSHYDIIHLFDLTRVGETYKYYKTAHKCRKNIIISPIYWDVKRYYKYRGDLEKIKLWERSNLYRKEILKGCNLIIANSELEKNILKMEFDVSTPIKVIYNGIEVEDDCIPLYNFRERYKLNNYVVCVGRISPKKNQLALAKACNILGIQLLLIGKVINGEYFEMCMKYNNVVYLGFMNSYNIYNAYRFAKVHALVSFVEKPGMSSLEAGACGCNIVSTQEGCCKEYFKDMAVYCDPYDEKSILNAVKNSFSRKKNSILKKYIEENYNINTSINKIYKNYEQVLKKGL
ncbi:glycosyltransferase family 4 protein [Haloimpatiens sp. FM7330]|uniref:glycosyltransferase family 4 protein n=1 Tax=Haloimpatiens sp. FM7330 TaxID=3298610 RepID=UPI00362ABC8C